MIEEIEPNRAGALYEQKFGRALRPQAWHDYRNDPCDEWPVFYWMGQPVPLLTSDDRLMARVLRHNVNAQYGKFGKPMTIGVDIETKPGETIVFIDEGHMIEPRRYREVFDYLAKSYPAKAADYVLGDFSAFDEVLEPKQAAREPDKGYDYQRHNKVRKRRP